jgi:EAL domain-containing protein (putative c-di-GMP-specific phosphodiesterase class I)
MLIWSPKASALACRFKAKVGLGDLFGQLVLEVTERSVPDRLGLAALEMASQLGVQIALDDMNMQAANAIVLSRCNVHLVKIDRSLVAQIGPDGEAPSWLVDLTNLSRSTELKIIAEGVETAAQAQALHEAGIALAQGFHFARPMSAGSFRVYFAEHS